MPCSIGLHPWYLAGIDIDHALGEIRKYASLPNVYAIGECGLDKVVSNDLLLQEQVFKAQIHVAKEVQKPLIIHCVKAYDEVMQLLRKHAAGQAAVMHGYNRNARLAQQLLDKGHYLSFGSALFLNNTSVEESLVLAYPDQFFLETDDSDVSIEDVYATAASILGVSIEIVIEQVNKNFKQVFDHE